MGISKNNYDRPCGQVMSYEMLTHCYDWLRQVRVTEVIRTRRKASLFSAFWLLLLARHQALLRPPHQKSLKNPRLFGRRISVEQIFSAGRKGAQRILDIFSSSLTNLRCKFADLNRVRMAPVTLQVSRGQSYHNGEQSESHNSKL